ncbi:MAG: methyl-accepting chemotaxis protein [Methylococcales bacterium]
MTIRNKLVMGFSSLVGIVLFFGLLSWLYIGWLGKNIDELVAWKVPAVKLAVDVHVGAYDATIEQLNYLLYENPEAHVRAMKVLTEMEQHLVEIDEIGHQFSDQSLLDQADSVRKNISDFRKLYERGVTSLENNKRAVAIMVDNGKKVISETNAFALKQELEISRLLNNDDSQEALNNKIQKYIQVNRIKALANKIIQHEKQERLYKNRQHYQQMQQEIPQIMALLGQLQRTTDDQTELKEIAVARNAIEHYSLAAAEWIKNDTGLKAIVLKMNKIAVDARNSAASAENDGWSKATEIGQQTVSLVNQAHYIILITLLVGAVIGVGLAIILPKNIIASITALSSFSKRFGAGNLKARTHFEPTDEIGVMAQDLDRAAINLQKIIQQVSDNASTLTAHSLTLSNAVENNADSIQQQKQNTEQVATAVSEMASTIIEVAGNASQAASSAAEADQQALEGSQVVTRAVNSINSLAGEIDLASQVITQLELDVGDISSILDVIRSVSEQTNLLALNAAIEAARAGEHGRGFAVVADEVRTLASRTQSSTDEIQAMIEKLQAGAKQAVIAMDTSQKMAIDSVGQASESGTVLAAITDSIKTISDMNTHIASASKEQTSVAEDINRSIVAISDLTEESVTSAQETSRAGQELAGVAEELKQAVGQFKI